MDPELQAIEDRQLQVIARLRQLRDSVDGLIKKAGAGEGQQKGGKVCAKPLQKAVNNRSSNTKVASSALPDVSLPSVRTRTVFFQPDANYFIAVINSGKLILCNCRNW